MQEQLVRLELEEHLELGQLMELVQGQLLELELELLVLEQQQLGL